MFQKDKNHDSVVIKLIKFCIPLILSGILQQLYNWADAFIVGNVAGDHALAAIGSTNTVINLFLLAITGFTLGLNVLFAQQYGSGKWEKITMTLSSFTGILGAASFILAGIGIACTYPLLRLLDTTPDTIQMAQDYLQIILIGIPFLAVYNIYTAALRGTGNSQAPFFSILISSVINIILDILLVAVFSLGVKGAAIATIISQIAMTAFIIWYSRRYEFLRLHLTAWRTNLSTIHEGISLGFPPMLQSCVNAVGNLFLQNFMNGFGTQTVAAITTAYRVDTIIFLPMINIGSGISTIVAQNYGAGKQKESTRAFKAGMVLMVIVSLALSGLVIQLGGHLIAIFGVSPEATKIGRNFFQRISCFYVVYGLSMSIRGYLEGSRDVLYSSMVGITALISRIIFSYSFAEVCGNMMIAYAEAASWGVMLLLYTGRVLWKRKFH